ncbi:2-isopropylmalate synthase [archaeon]|jgi:2-isopropylmalate synthase|nr:2-isopropylmalate synthase [archaeon]
MKKIKILDTTLRDGEQTPGLSLSPQQKLKIAKQLAKLNVDVIEAGFPASNEDDFMAAQLIAREVKGPTVCGFGRAIKGDIDAIYEAIKDAPKKRMHVFLATSSIHLDKKLKKTEDEALKMIHNGVAYAKSFDVEVQFTPEDASRTNFDYMIKTIKTAVDAGATIINIADTVGNSQPFQFYKRVKGVYNIFKREIDSGEITLSVHCHNDKGQAVANTLAGVLAGATQVECCINGIGERTGNAALEEIAMNIFADSEYFKAYTGVKTKKLYETCQMVSKITKLAVPGNKPIVGYNAFRHESGIHQHGVINDPKTYEVFSPADIGWVGTSLVIGKHSGKYAEEYLAKT